MANSSLAAVMLRWRALAPREQWLTYAVGLALLGLLYLLTVVDPLTERREALDAGRRQAEASQLEAQASLRELEAKLAADPNRPYREALDKARAENKLVLVNFTGYACTNCHWMKANMFPRPEIASALGEFVLVELYTDGLDAVAETNQKLQERYNTISQPFYVVMKPDETVVAKFSGSTRDAQEFLRFLNTRPL